MRDIKCIIDFFLKSSHLNLKDMLMHSIDMISIEPLSFSGLNLYDIL